MPFCKFCGAKLNDGDTFCSSCGNKNEITSPSGFPTPEPVSSSSDYSPSPAFTSAPSETQASAAQQPAPEQPSYGSPSASAQPSYGAQPTSGQPPYGGAQPAPTQTPYGGQPASGQSPYGGAQPAAGQGYRVYGQNAAGFNGAPAGNTYAGQPSYGAQPASGQTPYGGPAYGGGAQGGKKKSNALLFVIIGVLAVALIVVAVILITGNKDDGSVSDNPGIGGSVGGNTAPAVPDVGELPPMSDAADEAQAALQAFFDDAADKDAEAMLAHFWELSESSSSDIADFAQQDMEDYGYSNEAEQCGDWVDNLLAYYCEYFTYNNIWVYDGIDRAEVTYFSIDDTDPADDVFVPAYAVVDITPAGESSPTTVELPFSMAKYDGEWFVVFKDPQRAANMKAQNCITGYLATAVRGKLYNHLTYAYTYGTGDDYDAKIKNEVSHLYGTFGINGESEEITVTSALLEQTIKDFATSDVSGLSIATDNLYSMDVIIEDVSFNEDLSTYPGDAAVEFTCYLTITVTTDYESESYKVDLEVPMCRDTDGYYYVRTTY